MSTLRMPAANALRRRFIGMRNMAMDAAYVFKMHGMSAEVRDMVVAARLAQHNALKIAKSGTRAH